MTALYLLLLMLAAPTHVDTRAARIQGSCTPTQCVAEVSSDVATEVFVEYWFTLYDPTGTIAKPRVGPFKSRVFTFPIAGVDSARITVTAYAAGRSFRRERTAWLRVVAAARVDTLYRVDTVRISTPPIHDTTIVQLPPRVDTVRVQLPPRVDTVLVTTALPPGFTITNVYGEVKAELNGQYLGRLVYLPSGTVDVFRPNRCTMALTFFANYPTQRDAAIALTTLGPLPATPCP